MIDSHIHLDDDRFNLNRVELISQAMDAGVSDFIVPAVHVESFSRIKKLVTQYPQVKAAFGLHPYFIAQHQPIDLETLDKCLSNEPAIALGECGLDFYLKNLDKQEQYYYFEAQIELAKKHQLALILHVRGAIDAVFEQ
ncbi:MAG: TatD family hydrolase, partial [Proteobacteria bacterium]|nr:TatD family hydrolase [Pseudomonadota bacterium]